jgi:uncharacterized membrane protein
MSNAFGCSKPGAGACNPFGCPNPGAGRCTPFGCPEAPPNNNPNPSGNNSNSSSNNSSSQGRQICNNSGETINLAIGYQGDGVSKGWWTLNNSRCLTLDNHPVHGVVTHFYAFTVRANNRARWNGDSSRTFCISNQEFEIDSRGGCFNGAQSRAFGTVGEGTKNLTP